MTDIAVQALNLQPCVLKLGLSGDAGQAGNRTSSPLLYGRQ